MYILAVKTDPWQNQSKNKLKSKGSVSQLMDDFDLINSVEQVEAMVNCIQKGVEDVLRK